MQKPEESLQLVEAAVQFGFDGLEVRPVIRLEAPTLQHDFIEQVGAVGRRRHPVAV